MNDSADQLSDESSGGNPVAIARIVGDFAKELERGGDPGIEEFLRLVAAGDRQELLQCLVAEWVEWHLCRGTEPQLAQMLARFPDREDVVKAGFKAGTAAFESQQNVPDAADLPPTELAPPPRPSKKEIPAGNAPLPDAIGPYAVKERIGSGQFGDVYHAWDPTHNRAVALKCVRSKQSEEPSDAQRRMFLDEWRKLEGLSHEGIVRVYGVLQHEGNPVIVQELVQGGTLRELLKRSGGHLPLEQAVSLTMDICRALVYLHSQKICHRDLKPDNVLLDVTGRAKLLDFGLALHRSDRSSTPYAVAGSLAYMAPEQILGKAHLQDGRCDLWAVGVMLYEMIVGERPFQEASPSDLKRAILHGAATPPHQINSAIPRALGDICQSCLERKLRNRYSSAQDVLADLGTCLSPEPPQQSQQLRPTGAATASDSESSSGSVSGPRSGGSSRSGPVEVSPPTLELRGLRSFGEDDAEIFLQLLPGRRASDGLPTEVSGFRRKLEQCEAQRTFPVGLIHGPSGCGKTSLMRAGIQPRLAAHVSSVYLECSGEGTESRLRHELQRNFPNLPADVRLSEVVLRMIEGEWLPAGRKLVVVLDQFEQWLYRHGAEARTELGDALAECDGGRVQFVLMIRDDFWSGLERFLQRTDLPVTDDSYRLFVDVFDRQHGERVLTLLGQGAGCLPQRLTTECQQFVRQAVQQLAGAGGTVDCARLSLLAFMLRRQQWKMKTLQSLGGLDGLGERFLSQSFTDAGADPVHRRYVTVARAVLGALLPDEGQDIRTQRVSRSSLESVVQRVDRHADAGLVLRILDRELRLITPAEPDPTTSVVTPGETGNSAVRVPGYQLTHDYLVPSLRRWINTEQERTAAGRAERLLERRERLYRGKRERRQLPSLMEWAQIRWHVPRGRWTEMQQQMMSVAGAWHLVQSAIASTVLMILLFSGLLLYSNTLVENVEQLEVAGLVDAARDMQPVRFIVGPLLERKQRTAMANDNAELATKTLLTRLPLGADRLSEGDLELLQDAVTAAKPADLVHLTSLLQPVNRDLVPRLQALLENSGEPATKRLNAACVLAGLTTDNQAPWSRKSTSEFVVGELFSIAKQAPATIGDYERAIRSQATHWVPVVADTISATPVSDEVTPGIWQLLTLDGDVRNRAVDYLKTELMQPEWTQRERMDRHPRLTETQQHQFGERRSALCTAILRLNSEQFPADLLADTPANISDPTLRNLILHRIPRFGVLVQDLVAQLETSADPGVRRAAIQGLGELAQRKLLTPSEQVEVGSKLRTLYHDRDPGLHSAAAWALRQLGQGPTSGNSAEWKIDDGPFWERRKFGSVEMEFAVIDGRNERGMGTVSEIHELQRPFKIGHCYAIGLYEVTEKDYASVLGPEGQKKQFNGNTPSDKPVRVNWYQAAEYCNWLSEQDGLSQDQWCYEGTKPFGSGMILKKNWGDLKGYRLPSEAEWEFVCRAGTGTQYSCGDNINLLGDYGWYIASSASAGLVGGRLGDPFAVGQKRPNRYGLFDLCGNLQEWCQDSYVRGQAGGSEDNDELITDESSRVLRGGSFVDSATYVRSALRDVNRPLSRYVNSGFRVSRTYRLPP